MPDLLEFVVQNGGAWGLGKGLDWLNSGGKALAAKYSAATTDFLNHDPAFLNRVYADVSPKLAGTLPYLELADFSMKIRAGEPVEIPVSVDPSVFFTQAIDPIWAQARAKAYLDYRSKGKAGSDSEVLRISKASVEGGELRLSAQPTRYFCQAESNLVLDRKVTIQNQLGEADQVSLRGLITQSNGARLPDLADPRLANSLGVAICFLSKHDDGSLSVRMVHRNHNVAVFPNGIHPAMSCGIRWPDDVRQVTTMDLMDMILPDIEEEMRQETGLSPAHYSRPVPLSFCREFLRGGKPQLFCLSVTGLSPSELIAARDQQMAHNKRERPEKVEMRCSGLIRSNDPSVVLGKNAPIGLTHEGAASLFLIDRFFRKANPDGESAITP